MSAFPAMLKPAVLYDIVSPPSMAILSSELLAECVDLYVISPPYSKPTIKYSPYLLINSSRSMAEVSLSASPLVSTRLICCLRPADDAFTMTDTSDAL